MAGSGRKVRRLSADVFAMAYERLYQEYKAGHRLVVATSGGKDSIVCTELAIMAARDAGRLPVEVATRDEEIMYPGTFEYLERLAERPEVSFKWLIAHMPIVNVFSRKNPYWWTFDTRLEPGQWVRQPPPWHETISDLHIKHMVTRERYPIEGDGTDPTGQRLYTVTGIRAAESPMRVLAIHSSGRGSGFDQAHITQPNDMGVRHIRPIYDWEDGDVWKFIRDNQFDYNHAYDVMHRLGHGPREMRIAPPTMRVSSLRSLRKVHGAWPRWFDRVCRRVEGMRTAVQYGERALYPERRLGETWQQVYQRVVLAPGNPEWIRERGRTVMEKQLAQHGRHATGSLPDAASCPECDTGVRTLGSWKALATRLYMGDPFSLYQTLVPEVEPDYFRPGAGTWGAGAARVAGGV